MSDLWRFSDGGGGVAMIIKLRWEAVAEAFNFICQNAQGFRIREEAAVHAASIVDTFFPHSQATTASFCGQTSRFIFYSL